MPSCCPEELDEDEELDGFCWLSSVAVGGSAVVGICADVASARLSSELAESRETARRAGNKRGLRGEIAEGSKRDTVQV